MVSMVYLFVYLFVHLSVYRSIYTSIFLSILPIVLSIFLSIYQSINVPLFISTCLSVYLSVDRVIYLSLYLPYLSISLSLYIYLSIHPSIHLSTYLPTYLSIYLSICLCVYLSIYQSIYLSIYSYLFCLLSICSFTCFLSFLPFFFSLFFLSSFFSSAQRPKKWSERVSFFKCLTSKRAARHNSVQFLNISASKSAPNRIRCAFYILTWKCASCHNGVHFLIYLFARFDSFSSLTFFLFLSLLWLFPPLLLHLSILSKVWLLNFLRWMMIWMVGSGFRIGGSFPNIPKSDFALEETLHVSPLGMWSMMVRGIGTISLGLASFTPCFIHSWQGRAKEPVKTHHRHHILHLSSSSSPLSSSPPWKGLHFGYGWKVSNYF